MSISSIQSWSYDLGMASEPRYVVQSKYNHKNIYIWCQFHRAHKPLHVSKLCLNHASSPEYWSSSWYWRANKYTSTSPEYWQGHNNDATQNKHCCFKWLLLHRSPEVKNNQTVQPKSQELHQMLKRTQCKFRCDICSSPVWTSRREASSSKLNPDCCGSSKGREACARIQQRLCQELGSQWDASMLCDVLLHNRYALSDNCE